MTRTTPISATQFGPDYAVSVGGIQLNPNQPEQVRISANGRQLVY